MQAPYHTNSSQLDVAIIGGGAAGFFTALTIAELNPRLRISIFEKGNQFLSKVKISGGGRCNVTHHCFDPKELATRYPRGTKELRSAFHRWQPQDTIDWFQTRGIDLKVEPDGRMFPVTDKSQTIIDCFTSTADKLGIGLNQNTAIKSIYKSNTCRFTLQLSTNESIECKFICMATGSLKASSLRKSLSALGHTIEPLAPSLFAFNTASNDITELAGLSVPNVQVSTGSTQSNQNGPLLITHRGFSGPAILRLSAWEALNLQELNYEFTLNINWLGKISANQIQENFALLRSKSGKSLVRRPPFESIPRRLWDRFFASLEIDRETKWSQLPKAKEKSLIELLTKSQFQIVGKTTNKDEFVTCGGVRLKEVDFRTMQSRIIPNLFFAGECLDIDGITGGFNFQAAWTTGRIAGSTIASI